MAIASLCAAALSVTACGSSGSSADAVGWTDKVCGSLLSFNEIAKQQPKLDPTNPTAAVRSLSTYFGQVVDGAQQAVTGLDQAGKSPVAGGDDIIVKLKDGVTKLKTAFADAKVKLDAINPADPRAAASIPAALAPLQQLASAPNPATDLKTNAELEKAAAKAPNCQKAGVGAK